MNKKKEQRLLDAIFAPHFQADLIRALNRQGAALEQMAYLHERNIELQGQNIAISQQIARHSEDMASIAKHQYAARLQAENQPITQADATR